MVDAFGTRLVCVLHHGSWARGEGTPEGDIDTMVVLDRIEAEDLEAYRGAVNAMPNAARWASGLLSSVSELRAEPRSALVQHFYGRKVLHGSLEGIVTEPSADDLVEDVRRKAAWHVKTARHHLLFSHDLREKVHRLRYPFKECFFGLQAWMLAKHSKFYGRKDDLLAALTEPDDRAVVEAVTDWREGEADREARPRYYIELLERWCRSMLGRVGECENASQRDVGRASRTCGNRRPVEDERR